MDGVIVCVRLRGGDQCVRDEWRGSGVGWVNGWD